MATFRTVHVIGNPEMPKETRDALIRLAEAVWRQHVGEPVPQFRLVIDPPPARKRLS